MGVGSNKICKVTYNGKTYETPFNTLLKNGETYRITTDVANFSYWSVLIKDKDDKYVELTRCYNKNFNYMIYNDCEVKLVTGESGNQADYGFKASVDFLGYSRNPFNDASTTIDTGNHVSGLTGQHMIPTANDKVYADFSVSYNFNDRVLSKLDTAKVMCGLALVFADDASEKTYTFDQTSVKNLILGDANGGNDFVGQNKTYTDGNMKVINKNISRFQLNNKNRIDYAVGYNNSDSNRGNKLKVYSYLLVDHNFDGVYESIAISEAVDMCYGDIPFLAFNN